MWICVLFTCLPRQQFCMGVLCLEREYPNPTTCRAVSFVRNVPREKLSEINIIDYSYSNYRKVQALKLQNDFVGEIHDSFGIFKVHETREFRFELNEIE